MELLITFALIGLLGPIVTIPLFVLESVMENTDLFEIYGEL